MILLWNLIKLRDNINGTALLIMSCKTLLIIHRKRRSLSRYTIKMSEMLSVVVFKSLLKYQTDGREYLWQRSPLSGPRTRVPFGLHGGKGDVVRLRETIVRTLRKRTRCGEARGIKADSHAHAHVFVCVMIRNRRKKNKWE